MTELKLDGARKCPECDELFAPNTPWHKYDKWKCKQSAYLKRQLKKLGVKDGNVGQK